MELGWDADSGNITLLSGTFKFNAANPLRANTFTVKNGVFDLNNFSDDGTGSHVLESGVSYATKIRGNTKSELVTSTIGWRSRKV